MGSVCGEGVGVRGVADGPNIEGGLHKGEMINTDLKHDINAPNGQSQRDGVCSTNHFISGTTRKCCFLSPWIFQEGPASGTGRTPLSRPAEGRARRSFRGLALRGGGFKS